MRQASFWGSVLLVGIVGCAGMGGGGFGPFPSSGIGGGQLMAGVAGFIPGTVPREGEFSLLIVNTDAGSTHTVTVTPAGGQPITRDIAPCSLANVAVSCDAPTILIEINVPGEASPPSFTLTPIPGACSQRLVYIAVPIEGYGNGTGGDDGTGGDGDELPELPWLTETLPPSAVNCGLGGLPEIPDGFGS